MKFPYIQLVTGVYRPILPFILSYKGGVPLKYFGLLDSGADKTYLDAELAGILGIEKLESGRAEYAEGVKGISIVYFHSVMINIGKYKFPVEVGFIKDSTLASSGYGLLGQIGLFDHFDITFRLKKLEIQLTASKY